MHRCPMCGMVCDPNDHDCITQMLFYIEAYVEGDRMPGNRSTAEWGWKAGVPMRAPSNRATQVLMRERGEL